MQLLTVYSQNIYVNIIPSEREHSCENTARLASPATFRLPKPGHRDPYFGLPRTAYYELEKAGAIRLIRLCKRGYTRGTTLIPFDLAYVRSHAEPID